MLDSELWLGYRAVMLYYSSIPAWREWLESNRDKVTDRLYGELTRNAPRWPSQPDEA